VKREENNRKLGNISVETGEFEVNPGEWKNRKMWWGSFAEGNGKRAQRAAKGKVLVEKVRKDEVRWRAGDKKKRRE